MITICWWPHLHFDGLIEATGRREGQKCLAKEENGQKSKFFVESHWKFEFLQFWLLSLNFSSSTKKKILSKDPQRKKIDPIFIHKKSMIHSFQHLEIHIFFHSKLIRHFNIIFVIMFSENRADLEAKKTQHFLEDHIWFLYDFFLSFHTLKLTCFINEEKGDSRSWFCEWELCRIFKFKDFISLYWD